MNQLESLVLELKENSISLKQLIEQQNTKPALELIERRLVILAILNDVVISDSDKKAEIHILVENLLPLEMKMISELSNQKETIEKKLKQISKASDAEKIYRNIAEK